MSKRGVPTDIIMIVLQLSYWDRVMGVIKQYRDDYGYVDCLPMNIRNHFRFNWRDLSYDKLMFKNIYNKRKGQFLENKVAKLSKNYFTSQ